MRSVIKLQVLTCETGSWMKMHHEKPQNLYPSLNIRASNRGSWEQQGMEHEYKEK